MAGELTGDFTRETFHRYKHYQRVCAQQGRVSIDADWNEQTSILVHHHRTLARDVFGAHGASAASVRGFEITSFATPGVGPVSKDFRIGAGHYYVQGVLCEVEAPSIPVVGFPPGQNGVLVEALTLDGKPFEQSEYVEVYDANPANQPNPIVAQILGDPANGTLLLDSAIPPAQNARLRVRRVTTYLTQPDYDNPTLTAAVAGRKNVVYLDVWERHLTYVQDYAIREVALGTADTASRSKIVWQVKVAALDATIDVKKNYDAFLSDLRRSLDRDHPRGMLKARATPDVQSPDPCTMSPDARYRGVENQLYRVEVHRGGHSHHSDPKKSATFKWSRENASVVFPIASGAGTRTVTLEHLGRDTRSSLQEGDLVEARDDTSTLHNRAGHLLRVEAIDRVNRQVTLSDPVQVGPSPATHPILVRWDHAPDSTLHPGSDRAAIILEGSANHQWLPLEDGIEIQFQEALPGLPHAHYHTGDYWLIPARTATGDVEWPIEIDGRGQPIIVAGAHVPLARPPHGIEHWYAPLAEIKIDANGNLTANPADRRRQFDIPWT